MSQAVQQAMARRGMGGQTPQLSQVSEQAPMQNPVPQPEPASAANKQSAPQVSAPQQSYKPQNQQDMIVNALIEQLKNTNKLETEKMKMSQAQPSMGAVPVAQTQQPIPAAQAAPQMPMGGGGYGYDAYSMGGGGFDDNKDLFAPPMNSSKSRGYFEFGAPAMSMATNQKQNQFGP